MMDINGLFVWILGSVIRVIQLISILKKLLFFRTFQSLGSGPIGSRVITGFIRQTSQFSQFYRVSLAELCALLINIFEELHLIKLGANLRPPQHLKRSFL